MIDTNIVRRLKGEPQINNKYMFLEGFTPYEILMAARSQILASTIDSADEEIVEITTDE